MIKKFIAINRSFCRKLVAKYPAYYGSNPYKRYLLQRIQSTLACGGIERVLETGGIDRPLLAKNKGYKYDGLDIESRDRCYEIYDDFIVQSIEEDVKGTYDLIISITLLEHVPNNTESIRSMFNALGENGVMHHYVPSKWHPYSVALRMVGPFLQSKLIPILRPQAKNSGYPAFFNLCTEPAMTRVMRAQGFKEVEATAFYRASDYFAFFVPFFIVVTTFENICKRFNLSIFASGFVISAGK